MSRAGMLFALVVVVACPVAHATVYTWKGPDGVLTMSNDPADVPAEQQASAQKYTAKAAPPRPDPEPDAGAPAWVDAYQRGLDAGLQAADRRAAYAEDLARTALAIAQRPAPPPVVIQQPPPVAPDVAYAYATPYYGMSVPYAPYYGGAPVYPIPYQFGLTIVRGNRRFGHHGRHAGAFFGRGGFSGLRTGWIR